MPIEPVPEPLAAFLSAYCDVNAMEMILVLSERVRRQEIPTETVSCFRQQLIDAIHGKILTPAQYRILTNDDDYPTSAELINWLRQLWAEIFVDEDIPE